MLIHRELGILTLFLFMASMLILTSGSGRVEQWCRRVSRLLSLRRTCAVCQRTRRKVGVIRGNSFPSNVGLLRRDPDLFRLSALSENALSVLMWAA
jgi:hypothetical protein